MIYAEYTLFFIAYSAWTINGNVFIITYKLEESFSPSR